MLSKTEVSKVFDILLRYFGETYDTELYYENHYQLLIAVMLSAQATDKNVNKVVNVLFKIIKTPEDTLKLGEKKLNFYIKTINYHNIKAKHIIEASRQIINKFNSRIPDSFDNLISLPGVGRKTANLIMSLAFKKPYIAVDTHVFRVANRLGIVRAKNVLETEKQLLKNVPVYRHRQINNLLIRFGRTYCKAKKPHCAECILNKFCSIYNSKSD